MATPVDLLQNVSLFKELSAAELQTINGVAKVQTYAAGDQVFGEGDPADALYVIKFGSVRISHSARDNEVDIAQLGSGSHFGEMSFVDGEPRSATVEVLEKSELVCIGFAELKTLFDKHPAIAVKAYQSLAHFLCRRLRVTTTDLSFARERKNTRHS
jgi:CRP-like cAMP-binding protein